VHVVDDDRPRRIVDHDVSDARQMLADLTRALKEMDGVSCTTQVLLDDPFAGLVEAAKKALPDLLVMGPHRRQILRDAFVGTTAERMIRSVSCPVLTVNGPPVGPWRHMLLTTDLSQNAGNALRRWNELGFGAGARTSVLCVFDAPALRLNMSNTMGRQEQEDYLRDLSDDARKHLSASMTQIGMGQAEKVVRHEETTIANEFLNSAEKFKADLIVVSTQGKGAVARMVLGSVAQQILKEAIIDVLAIPPGCV